jgi:RHS repeat-associated protein
LDAANLEVRYSATYAYDALGQMIRENNQRFGFTFIFRYDQGGNLLTRAKYPYTTAQEMDSSQLIGTSFFLYGDANWKDKLTSYGGAAITYDAIGNPLTYSSWTYTWKAGRMLHSMSWGGTYNIQFTYDHNGLRVKKTVNGVDTLYTMNGKRITHIRKGANGASGADATQMHFFYDAQGRVAMVRYNGTDYAYLHSLQGDIAGLVDMNGNLVVQYWYSAEGRQMLSGSLATTLGKDNPFRYRGYVYDDETGLYYLRSRYYYPTWERFLNADVQLTGSKARLFDHNVFSYCHQNPVNKYDLDGTTDITATAQLNLPLSVPALAPWLSNPITAALAIGFYILLQPAATANSDAYAIPGYNDGLVATSYSKEQVKEETQTLDIAPALPKQENDLVIYRYGGIDPKNLVPTKDDVNAGDGLSFSTKPRDDSAMTTIGAVNATGILVAVHDKPRHVSVRPRFATLKMWWEIGVTSPFTLALKAIVVHYRER